MNKVISLIENAAYMTIELEYLREKMIKQGLVSEYQNGENQWGTKKSPEVEIFSSMIKNHKEIIKLLTDLTPEVLKDENKTDEFLKILKRDSNG